MVDYEKEFSRSGYSVGSRQTQLALTFRLVYGWMAVALVLSGVVAWFTATSGFYRSVLQGPGLVGCMLAEIALVFVLSLAINRLPLVLAYLLFALYAAVNGLTLSIVFIAFKLALVQKAFFITAGMFGGFVLWGSVTKSSLASVGSVCGLGLWGLIIASVVNLFTHSSGLDWVISFAGILVFTGLTMFDAQKISQMAQRESTLDNAAIHRIGVLGALQIYLDFINLFLYVIRFLNQKRD